MSKVLIDFGKCSFALRARCIISRVPLSRLSFSPLLRRLLLDCSLLMHLSLPSSAPSSDISFFRIICRFLDDNNFFCQKYLCFICRKLSRFSRLGRITFSIPSPQQLRVIVVSLGIEEMETGGCSLAISIKDDIGEYSVKWEGKWGAENWGF